MARRKKGKKKSRSDGATGSTHRGQSPLLQGKRTKVDADGNPVWRPRK